jgi:cardiolipin-specific phospholipase
MGCSSREPYTYTTHEESLEYFMKFIETWRKTKDLTNFFLCGHSLGGFLASIYTTKYPQHVKKLILLSPVGFTQKPDNFDIGRIEVIDVFDDNGRKIPNKGPP